MTLPRASIRASFSPAAACTRIETDGHCAAGVSRTSAYAAAYLALRLGISGSEALDRLTACHPVADPNRGFRAALNAL